jgi:flagellar biosynthesis protein FlhG
MTDQAADLRALAGYDTAVDDRAARVFAVASGKGGVGKSTLVANLGLCFARMGLRTLILDGDVGLANIDILLNLDPPYSINHVIRGHKSLEDVIVEGPFGVKLIPGASGLFSVANLDADGRGRLLAQLAKAGAEADVVLIDTPAGIGHDVISLAAAAQDVIIVATPEPTSIRDAYALIKVLWQRSESPSFRLLVNRASNKQVADAAAGQISSVARRFLKLEIDSLGYLPDDARVSSAVRKQEALVVAYPKSPAARGVEMLAEALLNDEAPLPGHRGLMGFVHRIVRSRDRAVAV